MNAPARTGSCPPLPPEKQSKPYEPLDGKAGHEGHPPVFETRKEFPWVDGKREPSDSNYNINHSRLAFLYANKRIEERQYLAGERLARDYEMSMMPPRASTVLVGNGGSGGGSAADSLQRKIDAGERYAGAIRILGRGADIVVLVVIANMTVGKAAANLGFKSEQKAWGRFDVKLHDLADHYRL